jgi:hypothetical protein
VSGGSVPQGEGVLAKKGGIENWILLKTILGMNNFSYHSSDILMTSCGMYFCSPPDKNNEKYAEGNIAASLSQAD